MRYASFSLPTDSDIRPGVVSGDRIVDLRASWPNGTDAPLTLLDLIRRGSAAESAVRAAVSGPAATSYASSEVRWHAPIPRLAKNVFCVGRNYAAHVKEGAAAYNKDVKLPEVPVFFTNVPLHAEVTRQLDFEAELGVVVGRTGRDIERGAARSHVFGFTVLNDVTARDLQQRHTQWFKGKSLDGSCPMGPMLVTADEFGDPQAKRITLRINGVTKQDATTADMIFPVDTIIEWLSKGLTLEPGDVIATGTPEGVGMGRTPQEWLQEGDVIETEVEGIGVMRNVVTAAPRR
jgi:2-keto-4-pentenoate hydratase/2-oxohepta-3-ene-1,7-dioic acid hydratase in catechol pathway